MIGYVFILVVLFIVLQAADVGTTLAILRAGGREKNKLVRAVMDRIGQVPALVLLKAIAIALVVWAARTGYFASQYGLGLLAALVVFYIWVVYSNVQVMRRQ